ncbi:Ras-related small GTP-binding family protein [Zea mays]|uniref:Ras-related small GTP-binding family protein n=1 Tax=Zea mays TaxID=4577 RepID=A0A1D6GS59_MAIZE|nr:Ras-related small GTP-binding family protein [Zea mays]AQK65879.1 Ras-related small GTP-binding family protein [Zea mays]AQK65881.1 Ras-related small GTP-binding family protein [Zea mays]AQK65882.1 Ras-related small GTP-binding family protein [Zea mays]AQK65886.1 Ras-related small GTP-binding family protein [Zea mays]
MISMEGGLLSTASPSCSFVNPVRRAAEPRDRADPPFSRPRPDTRSPPALTNLHSRSPHHPPPHPRPPHP